ncbi:MAG: hypothetical protein NVSMB66_2460 [Candidatus Doudnabacteria bacterium]
MQKLTNELVQWLVGHQFRFSSSQALYQGCIGSARIQLYEDNPQLELIPEWLAFYKEGYWHKIHGKTFLSIAVEKDGPARFLENGSLLIHMRRSMIEIYSTGSEEELELRKLIPSLRRLSA